MATKTRRYRILSTEGLAPGESPGVINDNIEAVEWRDDLDRPHRVGSPAIKYLNGSYGYYINGAPHREDGPALKNNNGCFYYVNGLKHREDGPAIISKTYKCWYQDGKLHRLDGPAIENYYGYQWWIDGNVYLIIDHDGWMTFSWNGYSFDSEEEWFEFIPEDFKIKYLFYKHSIKIP